MEGRLEPSRRLDAATTHSTNGFYDSMWSLPPSGSCARNYRHVHATWTKTDKMWRKENVFPRRRVLYEQVTDFLWRIYCLYSRSRCSCMAAFSFAVRYRGRRGFLHRRIFGRWQCSFHRYRSVRGCGCGKFHAPRRTCGRGRPSASLFQRPSSSDSASESDLAWRSASPSPRRSSSTFVTLSSSDWPTASSSSWPSAPPLP